MGAVRPDRAPRSGSRTRAGARADPAARRRPRAFRRGSSRRRPPPERRALPVPEPDDAIAALHLRRHEGRLPTNDAPADDVEAVTDGDPVPFGDPERAE